MPPTPPGSRFRNKITEILKLQPQIPCNELTAEQLIEEEARCRNELVRLVLSLSLHVGTCTTHGVLSAGTSLPLHLPVVVWIAYSLTRTARRHRALRVEVRTNRPHIQLKKVTAKRFALPVVLGLLSPILAALGADILNDIVLTLVGSDTLASIKLSGSGGLSISDQPCAPDDPLGVDFVLASADNNVSGQINLTKAATEEAIGALLERWAEHLVDGVPEDFARLVEDLQPENISSRAGLILPHYYQVYCEVCKQQINNGFSCLECHELDLCRSCYCDTKHPDVKRHEYEEFRIEEELDQIQRIMASLRRENITVSCARGGYVRCDKCQTLLSTPSTNLKTDPIYYYTCKTCHEFDVCLECFPKEMNGPAHKGHTFGMIVATDDEATISRISPMPSRLGTPRLPSSPGNYDVRQSPLTSPRTPVSSPGSTSRSSSGSYLSPTSATFVTGMVRNSTCWCDKCGTRIESIQHWHCFHPSCISSSSVDLHFECRDWVGGMHIASHDMRVVPTT